MNVERDNNEYFVEDEEATPSLENSGDEDAAGAIQKLKEKLRTCQKERQEFLDGWQRSKADFLNHKKRSEESERQHTTRARAVVLASILPLCDSFDMAFKDAGAWKAVDKSWARGVEAIHAQLQNILREHDVKELVALNMPFDPLRHDAGGHVPVETNAEHDTVIEVIQKGYMMGDVLLRPARVVVGTFTNKT